MNLRGSWSTTRTVARNGVMACSGQLLAHSTLYELVAQRNRCETTFSGSPGRKTPYSPIGGRDWKNGLGNDMCGYRRSAPTGSGRNPLLRKARLPSVIGNRPIDQTRRPRPVHAIGGLYFRKLHAE